MRPDCRIDDHLARIGADEIRASVLGDLAHEPRRIASMHFYDRRGSELFEAITGLPEYYPTRTEKGILRSASAEIAGELRDIDIVELGSGDCSKISILLDAVDADAMDGIRYVPVDVSCPAIEKSAGELAARFPRLSVYGMVADFNRQLHVLPDNRRRLFCFLGSTLGNLSPHQADDFFAYLSSAMTGRDTLLIGFDMIKEKDILERAYNDSSNITAAFNRNILNVVNRIAGTDFDPALFEHRAFYNEGHARVEMHLRATEDLAVSCPYLSRPMVFKEGDDIHTENSYKFTAEDIGRFARVAGLEVASSYTDDQGWFSLVRFVKDER